MAQDADHRRLSVRARDGDEPKLFRGIVECRRRGNGGGAPALAHHDRRQVGAAGVLDDRRDGARGLGLWQELVAVALRTADREK